MSYCADLERKLPSAAMVGENTELQQEDEEFEDPDLEMFRQSLQSREKLCHQWGRAITAHEIRKIEFQCWDSVGNRYAYSEQNSTVEKYYEEFCEWKRWMNIVCGWEDPEEVVVSIFIRGLREPIRNEMSSPLPTSLNRAYWEAIAIELTLRRMDPWLEKQSDGVDPKPVQDGADLDWEVQTLSAKVEEKNQMNESRFWKPDYVSKVIIDLLFSPEQLSKRLAVGYFLSTRLKLILILNKLDDCYDGCLRRGIGVGVVGNSMEVVGGEDAKRRKMNDLYMFDLKSSTWFPLHCTGVEPSARSNHVAALYDDKVLFVYEEFSAAKSQPEEKIQEPPAAPEPSNSSIGNSENWMVSSILGNKPPPLSNHAAAVENPVIRVWESREGVGDDGGLGRTTLVGVNEVKFGEKNDENGGEGDNFKNSNSGVVVIGEMEERKEKNKNKKEKNKQNRTTSSAVAVADDGSTFAVDKAFVSSDNDGKLSNKASVGDGKPEEVDLDSRVHGKEVSKGINSGNRNAGKVEVDSGVHQRNVAEVTNVINIHLDLRGATMEALGVRNGNVEKAELDQNMHQVEGSDNSVSAETEKGRWLQRQVSLEKTIQQLHRKKDLHMKKGKQDPDSEVSPNATLQITRELVSWKTVTEITTDKKVIKEFLKEEKGYERPNVGAVVQVKLTEKVQDEFVFLKKGHNDGEEPFEFNTDEEQFIDGMDRAVVTMKWGKRFEHGKGRVSRNLDEALVSFLKGAVRGFTLAMVDTGFLCWDVGRVEGGVVLYRRATELGNPVGQCNLAISYLEAEPSEPKEAVKWLYFSFGAGYAHAQYELAHCLHQGLGVSHNLPEAARWYLKAAAIEVLTKWFSSSPTDATWEERGDIERHCSKFQTLRQGFSKEEGMS